MIYSLIKKSMPDFSKNHLSIAQFILDNQNTVPFMTATELGKSVGVSESTVFRFAVFLGFKGYPALKDALRLETVKNLSVADRGQGLQSNEVDSEDSLIEAFTTDANTMLEYANNIDRAALYEVADAMIRADSVYIVGLRSCSSLSDYLSFYLAWLLPNTHKLDATYGLERISSATNRTVVVGISFNRCVRQVVDIMDIAMRRGAYTVAITNSTTTPPTKYAKKVLKVPCNLLSFIDSHVMPMSLMNALILAVAQRKPGDTIKEFQKLEEVWKEQKIYSTDEY